MLRVRAAVVLLLLALAFAFFHPGVGASPTGLGGEALGLEKEAESLLDRAQKAAAAGDDRAFPRLLAEAARQLDALYTLATWLPFDQRNAVQKLAMDLKAEASRPLSAFEPSAHLKTLEGVATSLKSSSAPRLSFLGSYSQTKVEEPAYGGHASAMGPPAMAQKPASNGDEPSPVQFEAVLGQLTEKTFSGGPSKLHLLESGGNGVALFDYDGDGLLDIYVVTGPELDEKNGRRPIPHRNALYHNLGGMRFENVAKKAGVDAASWGYGVCVGDYNNDGLPDLYVTNFGSNLLYRNNGDGTFTDVAAEAGVQLSGWSTGCAFLDGNGDGNLDLYVSRYVTTSWEEVLDPHLFLTWRGVAKVMLGPTGLPGAADAYFENQGDGTFRDVTEARGLKDEARAYGFGVVATDYDGDGWPDIYVANDSNPSFLYHNKGDGNFESVGLMAGVALNGEGRAQAGMGADAGDFDGDGLIDLAVTTFAFDNNTLFRNLGGGRFEDVSAQVGLTESTYKQMSWGMAFLDADLDGALDIFYANGHLFPQVNQYPALGESYEQKNQLFLNRAGHFHDVSDSAGGGLQIQRSSRAVAVGDLDNDGDPDIVVSVVDDVPLLLENKQHTGNHWIGFALRQAGRNPLCIGARVTVETSSQRLLREVRSGGGYLSQNDFRALFGIGSCRGPVKAEVRLGTKRYRWEGLEVDRYHALKLDATHLVTH